MTTKKDITGGKYTHLLALEPRTSNKHGAAIWLFRCDCGNEKELPLKTVTAGRTKSCGTCLLSSKLRQKRGVESGRVAYGWQTLYSRGIRRARKEDKTWALTYEEFRSISICPCRLCGTPPRTRLNNGPVRYSEVVLTATEGSYTVDNVTALCLPCRTLKGKLSVLQLIQKVYKIYSHSIAAI